jgi:deoxyribodipyrimidine photo-lyase
MSQLISIVWFRQDLRLTDNPALSAAAAQGRVVPVFIWSPEEEGAWTPGSASRWWLHQSLRSLAESLARLGSRLVLRRGSALPTLLELVRQTGAQAVYWNRRYEPAIVQRDATVKEQLRAAGLHVESYNASLLFEPWQIRNKQDRPFQVYTPFWNACRSFAPLPDKPLPAPLRLPAPDGLNDLPSLSLDALQLEPTIDWAAAMRRYWQPGEEGATRRLEAFLAQPIDAYDTARDRPDLDGTSSLSPHLHFGEISPRTIWHRICPVGRATEVRGGREVYLKELVWREFAYHLLYHFPHTTDQPLRSEYAAFPYRTDPAGLRAWQRGQTGYPMVDAGMRQLWQLGWMHNRVRMIVASFLVKHQLLPWQAGARWFWDTLVDADLASNTLGWQWVAGCGADAAPYFRIFNPVSQGEKFDPQGDYVRRWVPELARLPTKYLHKPWEAPACVLSDAGVRLGETYPAPIVDHATARERALAALATLSKSAT